jgi:hypothetical protein
MVQTVEVDLLEHLEFEADLALAYRFDLMVVAFVLLVDLIDFAMNFGP